jgi:hypothetical protein
MQHNHRGESGEKWLRQRKRICSRQRKRLGEKKHSRRAARENGVAAAYRRISGGISESGIAAASAACEWHRGAGWRKSAQQTAKKPSSAGVAYVASASWRSGGEKWQRRGGSGASALAARGSEIIISGAYQQLKLEAVA